MRIEIISTVGGGYGWAGSEEMWRMLAEFALSKGHQVTANISACMGKSDQLTKFNSLGGKILARKDLGSISLRLAQRGYYNRFAKSSLHQADVVVLSLGSIADCLWVPDLLRYYWKSNRPWVVIVQANSDHLIGNEAQRGILRQFYTKARRLVFVSQNNLAMARRQLALPLANAMVLPNPIRERLFEPLPWPSVIEGTWRLAEVARFEVCQKRQDHLLEALAAPKWQERKWKLSFYGAGPDEQYIRSLVAYFGLQRKVIFGGYVRDFREIWKHNHLHVLPTAYEGIPLALIESMFCGRPAVVTRAGGNAELVQDQVHGFVCPGMHPEIIDETLERAWAAREHWPEMGHAAFAHAGKLVPKDWEEPMLALLESAAAGQPK